MDLPNILLTMNTTKKNPIIEHFFNSIAQVLLKHTKINFCVFF